MQSPRKDYNYLANYSLGYVLIESTLVGSTEAICFKIMCPRYSILNTLISLYSLLACNLFSNNCCNTPCMSTKWFSSISIYDNKSSKYTNSYLSNISWKILFTSFKNIFGALVRPNHSMNHSYISYLIIYAVFSSWTSAILIKDSLKVWFS